MELAPSKRLIKAGCHPGSPGKIHLGLLSLVRNHVPFASLHGKLFLHTCVQGLGFQASFMITIEQNPQHFKTHQNFREVLVNGEYYYHLDNKF